MKTWTVMTIFGLCGCGRYDGKRSAPAIVCYNESRSSVFSPDDNI